MTCSNCKLWDVATKPSEGNCPDHGMCLRAGMTWEDTESPMLVEDGSCYKAQLFTHKDHSCSCFGNIND